MSGFGGVFAAVIVGVIFASAITSMTNLSVSSIMLLSSFPSPYDLQSYPSIEGGYRDSDRFLVNVSLSGSKPVRVTDLVRYADVLVVYYSGGAKVIERLNYPDGWSIKSVYTSGVNLEAVNPIDLISSTGIWDPGETIEIHMLVSNIPDVGSPWAVVIAINDGGLCTKSFGG